MAPEGNWPYVTPGVPDNRFEGGTLLTKEEIRALVLSKLRLRRDSVVWDVGAGTGSVAVEAALFAWAGEVWAVEKNPERCRSIEANAKAFGLTNLRVIVGTAPEALVGLPQPDRVFVGGSGGKLEDILEVVLRAIAPEGRLVVVAVTLETFLAAGNWLTRRGVLAEVVYACVAKAVPSQPFTMWRTQSPVYIFVATKG